jgi:hypothetical protein
MPKKHALWNWKLDVINRGWSMKGPAHQRPTLRFAPEFSPPDIIIRDLISLVTKILSELVVISLV